MFTVDILIKLNYINIMHMPQAIVYHLHHFKNTRKASKIINLVVKIRLIYKMFSHFIQPLKRYLNKTFKNYCFRFLKCLSFYFISQFKDIFQLMFLLFFLKLVFMNLVHLPDRPYLILSVCSCSYLRKCFQNDM